MRPANVPSRGLFSLTKPFSVVLSLALVGWEVSPAFARSNDDYYQTNNNGYANSYGPQGGYSAQSLDMQMQRMNARMQSFSARQTQQFDSNRYTAPKLYLSYQPKIQFTYSPSVKTPEIKPQTTARLDSFSTVTKPTLEVGQAQKLVATFKNLQEIAPGILETQRGKTVALGQTWEPGSKFKVEGTSLRLIEGTAYAPSFGGITRIDGVGLPIRFTNDGGKVKPMGIVFNLMDQETPLKIEAPLNIEGFGKILSGNMTFKGAIETAQGTMGKFQFQGAPVQLEGTMADTLDMSSPASLARATFLVEAAMMRLNSAVVQKGDKTLFVSEDRAPVEVDEITKAVTYLASRVGALQEQVSRLDQQLNQNSLAAQTVAKDMGYSTENLGVKPEDATTIGEVRLLAKETVKFNNDVAGGSFEDAETKIKQIQTKWEELTPRVVALENSAGDIKQVAKSLISERNARREIADSAKPKNILTWVGRQVVGIVAGSARAVVDVVRNSVELLGKLPIVGPMVKAAWRAKSEMMGDVFTVLSGDFLDKQPAIKFGKDPSKPAVITVNGIRNTKDQSEAMNNQIMKAFGISISARIANNTHGPKGILDFVQVIGHEYLGAYDRPVQNMAKAIRAGIEQKGEVYVVAHSQGTAIFAKSLELLTAEERSKIHYYGAGSEWFVDPKKEGLASGENVWNRKDIVPVLGNNLRVSNWIVPGEADRKFRQTTRVIGDEEKWRQIAVEWPGGDNISKNHHNFTVYYQKDMEGWAQRQLASNFLAGRN